MELPQPIQQLVDAGTLVMSSNEEDAYFAIPALAHDRKSQYGEESVMYELWVTSGGECFVEANGRYTGPEDIFDGDVEGAVDWIEEAIKDPPGKSPD
jgi:hypothetical protein